MCGDWLDFGGNGRKAFLDQFGLAHRQLRRPAGEAKWRVIKNIQALCHRPCI